MPSRPTATPCDDKLIRRGAATPDTSSSPRPRPTSSGHTNIFGGDDVLAQHRCAPGDHAHSRRRRRRPAAHALRDAEAEELRRRRGRGRQRPARSRGRRRRGRGSTTQARRGRCATYSYCDVLARQGAAVGVRREGRRHRCRPRRRFEDLHRRRRSSDADVGCRGPGEHRSSTALHGFPLRSAWSGWTFVLIVLFALLAPVARLWLRTWQALLHRARCRGALPRRGAARLQRAAASLSVTYPLLALAISCIGVLVAELTTGYAVAATSTACGPRPQTRVLHLGVDRRGVIALTLLAYFGHVMRSLEEKTVDARFDVRGSDGPPPTSRVVEIDDETFDASSSASVAVPALPARARSSTGSRRATRGRSRSTSSSPSRADDQRATRRS